MSNYGAIFDRKLAVERARGALREVQGSLEWLYDHDNDSILDNKDKRQHVTDQDVRKIIRACRAFECRIVPLCDTIEDRAKQS